MTLGALALRRSHYGVGQLEQRSVVGPIVVMAGLVAAVITAYVYVRPR